MTKAELVFIERMAYYIAQGMSFEEAGKTVLKDDVNISNFILGDSEQGRLASKALCVQTYYSIKSEQIVNGILTESSYGMVAEEIRQAVLK